MVKKMKLFAFTVTNYRNIKDSGWIEVGKINAFVGQNEAGKSNLFDALYRINPFAPDEKYNLYEDWPLDDWGSKDSSATVCRAKFSLTPEETQSLISAATTTEAEVSPEEEQSIDIAEPASSAQLPLTVNLIASRGYDTDTRYEIDRGPIQGMDLDKVQDWARANLPKFVLIQEYELSGTRIELDHLAERIEKVDWNNLKVEEQTIKIVLDLAGVDIKEFLEKGLSPEGRTIRSFDKRGASHYLSKQFRDLWTQKAVEFEIEIDATTLNILARDESVGMPVPLNRRSSGFRWHVAFAWKFTHASRGQYKNCILLLEEPGIHLHYSGQRDLLDVFERLSQHNTILYTTHLASMVDLGYPERVRIVESKDNHSTVKSGVVSDQKAPMAVIELALGLTGDMSGLLGNRQTLIVEGGDDALVLYKLSGILRGEGRTYLSDQIYLWPARGAQNTPMYASVAVGHGWDSGVLLDTDSEGYSAKKKIEELTLEPLADEQRKRFRVLMIGKAAKINKTNAAIEDLFDSEFYIECVNAAYGFAIKAEDLPVDGSDMITKRVATVLTARHGKKGLDKNRVRDELLRRFDNWTKVADLPSGVAERAETLFGTINCAFGHIDNASNS